MKETMNNDEINVFLKETKTIVTSGKRTEKMLPKLAKIGYVILKSKGSHHHLTHPLIGNAKITLACSPSCPRWCENFVSDVRHAIWKKAS